MNKQTFGKISTGQEAFIYTLRSGCVTLQATDYGAALVSLVVKDKDGRDTDVILGYDSVESYENLGGCMGGSIGRYGNRIAGGTFELNGKKWQLEKNEKGVNNLHSGPVGYHQRFWQMEELTENSITFLMDSPDGDQGFPGHLRHRVTYTVTDAGELIMDYRSVCDQDTPLNPTNHTYFNLDGQESGSILKQKLQLLAEEYTPIADAMCIPTGEFRKVEGTPFDFREPKAIGEQIGATEDKQIRFGTGYDHNFVLSGDRELLHVFARAWGAKSGIRMEAWTDLPGVQFYTGNHVDRRSGKNGAIYEPHCGFCLETQYYPNSINEPNFQTPVLRAGEEFTSRTVYQFTC